MGRPDQSLVYHVVAAMPTVLAYRRSVNPKA
ncbi:hypothetical protein FB566_3087 [Stackebrandtia endophytica]|uniref:Uncharacterized protein n=1 Tax=Stackebrandtia endophytica TaxID=1496996 RepID=A0A543AY77_9ACTN|nr:hypothetical protein FB566_3087 [Stackebrandtia endophytica]